MLHICNITSRILLALAFFLVSAVPVHAFSCVSNGTGGGNFNVASTWTGCNSTTPQTTDSITIGGGDTVTLVATTNVAGITINASGILAANTRALTNTDGYTNNGSHTGTTSTMTLSGPSGSVITGSGTYSPTGIVTVSVGDKTVATGSYLSFDKITVTGVILTNNSTAGLTVVTTLAGTGQLAQGSSSILNIGGTSTITTLSASASPNEVHYTSTTANQTIKAPSSAYHHLFIDKTGRVGTLGGATTVNGNLSVTAGSLADGGFQITGNATGTLTLAASTTLTLGTTGTATSFPTAFTAGNISLNTTSTVNYNSNSAQTISSAPTYGNLTTTATAAVTKTAGGALVINGLFTNGTNNTFADGGFTITLKDGATMTGAHTGAGKLLFSGGSVTHSVTGVGYNNVELDDSNGVLLAGTTTIGGTLTIVSGTWDTDARTITVTGVTTVSGTLLIASTTGTKTFGDIVISSGGILSFTAAEAMTVNGDLTVNGTGTVTGTSGTWTLQKVGGGTIGGTTTSLTLYGGVTYATQYSILVPLTVNTLTVNTGITQTNISSVTVNGTLAGAGAFTQSVGATLSARSITITTLNATAGGNTVRYTGAVGGTVKGTSYFNLDINKSTGFAGTASGTVSVAGTLTVTSGTLSFAGSTFSVVGTTDIYGTVTDSSGGASGGSTVFGGQVTLHPGSAWSAVIGEVCDFHFGGGLVMNGTSFVSSTGIYYFETNNQSITGSSSFTIDSISVTGITLTNSSSGTLTNRVSLAGTGTFIQGTGATLNLAGTNTVTAFDGSASANAVSYTGTSTQTVKDGIYDTLEVGTNTGNSVDLAGATTVNTQLILGDTTVNALASKMTLAQGATYTRGNGYVLGMVGKYFNASASFTFPIGDTTNYLPLELVLTSVTGSSSIEATTSAIDRDQGVNRRWSLTNNGLTFGSYDLVLNFAASDIDTGITATEMIIFRNGSGVTSTCASTTCTATGLSSMSEFQIGIVVASSSSSDSVPSGTLVAEAVNTVLASLPTVAELSEAIPALFDILSTPLLLGVQSGTLLPVLGSIFLVGVFCGFVFLIATRRGRRSRVLRIESRKQKNV